MINYKKKVDKNTNDIDKKVLSKSNILFERLIN